VQLKPTTIVSTQWLFKKARHYFALSIKNKPFLIMEFKTTHNGKSNIRYLWNFNPKNYPKPMAESVNESTCTEKKMIEITQRPH
jgi:hypothetical protein